MTPNEREAYVNIALSAWETGMAIGDQDIDEAGYGTEEIACPECVGLTGVVDPDCICCDGEGRCFKLIAPEGEIGAAFQNVMTQTNAIQRPH